MLLLSSCPFHWGGGSVSRLLFLIFKLSIGIRSGGSLHGVFLGEQDFGEGSYLPKKRRALCWLHASGGPTQGWLWHRGHRLGKALTPTPAMREGCRQCGLAQTLVGGSSPLPSEWLWGLGRGRLPQGDLPAQHHGLGPVPHGLARGLSLLPGSWGSLALWKLIQPLRGHTSGPSPSLLIRDRQDPAAAGLGGKRGDAWLLPALGSVVGTGPPGQCQIWPIGEARERWVT